MTGLVLALRDHERHVTDESWQLYQGLAHAGWTLAGRGFGDDDCADVPTLLERHRPSVVFCADPRDWHPRSAGCFDKGYAFARYEALRAHPFVATPLKDAGSIPIIQRQFLETIRPAALVTYYHERAVKAAARTTFPGSTLIRTYHSVDADLIAGLELAGPRERGIVTGATSATYPLRQRCFINSAQLGIYGHGHPGYSNRGCDTPRYLTQLAGYKVHVATASRFKFLLRKIIESVACGCTPVTDLPEWDVVPEVDDALVRVPPTATVPMMRDAIDRAEAAWDLDRALDLSRRACAWFDYRAVGARLSEAIHEAAGKRRAA